MGKISEVGGFMGTQQARPCSSTDRALLSLAYLLAEIAANLSNDNLSLSDTSEFRLSESTAGPRQSMDDMSEEDKPLPANAE